MRHKNSLIETDLKIITLLAEKGEYAQYDMDDRLEIAYRTIIRRLSELESIGLVKVTRRELSRKGGKKRKIYTLTFKGVVIYLASFSLEPVKLDGSAGETREEVIIRIGEDMERYRKEANLLIEFLEFYGKQLDYTIFKQVHWLVDSFPMKTEAPILSYVLKAARLTKSYFSASTGPSAFVKGLRSEKSRLKKFKRQIKRNPWLGKITLFQSFGGKKEEKIEVDTYEETVERLKRVEKDLETSLELENEAWKQWFAERFFERIVYLPTKGKMSNEALHRFVSDLLKRKKKREIAALENIVKLFS